MFVFLSFTSSPLAVVQASIDRSLRLLDVRHSSLRSSFSSARPLGHSPVPPRTPRSTIGDIAVTSPAVKRPGVVNRTIWLAVIRIVGQLELPGEFVGEPLLSVEQGASTEVDCVDGQKCSKRCMQTPTYLAEALHLSGAG
jgi:hypothetical protein